MPRTLCIANQKGGVGKTTTAINLAAGLAYGGRTVLLVDLDPQCNATTGVGLRPVDRHPLLDGEPLRAQTLESGVSGLSVLPGSRSFRDVDLLAQGDADATSRLTEHLLRGTLRYDFVLIDCPPSLGPLTQAALASSDEVLMPIQCEYFAMEGLTQMIGVIRNVIRTQRHQLEFAGILLTMYDRGLELTAEVDAQVREFFGEIVFDTVVPRDVAAAEAPSHGASLLDYAPRSSATRAYVELCMEVMEHDA